MRKFLLILFFFIISCEKQQKFKSTLYKVEKGKISKKIIFSGSIRAKKSVLVRATIDSQLVKLYQSLGSIVKKDQEIVTITEPKNHNRLNTIVEKEGELKQIELKISQLRLKIKSSKEELDRMARLLASGSVSRSEQNKAKIAYNLELKELDILNSKLNTTSRSIQLLKKSQNDSSQTLISPINGTITELWAPEDKITVGISIPRDTVIAIIEQPGEYVLRGDVTEPDYIRMNIGQKVNVELMYGSGRSWKGEIQSLYVMEKNNSYGINRFGVNILFSTLKEDAIRSGLEGRGTLVLDEKEDVLRIPRSAVKLQNSEYFVTIPTESGPTQHRIVTGLIGDQYIEVSSGLIEGNEIYSSYID